MKKILLLIRLDEVSTMLYLSAMNPRYQPYYLDNDCQTNLANQRLFLTMAIIHRHVAALLPGSREIRDEHRESKHFLL